MLDSKKLAWTQICTLESHSYIPVQFIKSFCCIEAAKRVKTKLQGRLILAQGGRRGYSKISFVHRLGLFFLGGVQILNCFFLGSQIKPIMFQQLEIEHYGGKVFTYFLLHNGTKYLRVNIYKRHFSHIIVCIHVRAPEHISVITFLFKLHLNF